MIDLKTFLVFAHNFDGHSNYMVFDEQANTWLPEFASRNIGDVLFRLREAVTNGFPAREPQKQDYQKTGVYHDAEIVMCHADYSYLGRFVAKPYKGKRWRLLKKCYCLEKSFDSC